MTDELLMHAVQGGELDALGELFERHHRPVFHFLSRTTGDAALAEDLVQEVFVRILKYRHTYDASSRFDTWLFRIARNARADHFRKQGPLAGVGGRGAGGGEPTIPVRRGSSNGRSTARAARAGAATTR